MTDDDIIQNIEVTQELIEETLKLMDEKRAKGDRSTGDPALDRMLNECFNCRRDKRDKTTEPCNACKPRPNYPDQAPEDQIFVCAACGKTSKSIYGEQTGLGGWDESCMLNAVLCYENRRDEKGLYVAVEGY